MVDTQDTQFLDAVGQDVLPADAMLSPEQAQSHTDFEDSVLAAGSSTRKRKAECCDGTNCGPIPNKRRLQSPPYKAHSELQEGRFLCGCSTWVSLRDENGYTLERWIEHLRVCEHSKSRGMTSMQDIMQAAAEIFPEKLIASSPAFFTAAQRFNESGTNEAVSLSTAQELLLTFETAQMSPARGESNSQLDDTHQSPTAGKLDEMKEYEGYPSYPSATPNSMINNHSDHRKGPKQRRPHRTEAERARDFRDDPQVADVEPYRVLCASCNKWIKLRNNSRYCSIPWTCHKACCSKSRLNTNRSSSQSSLTAVGSSATSINVDGDMEVEDDFQQNVHEEITSTTLTHLNKIDPAVPPPNMHPSLQLGMGALPLPTIIRSGLSSIIDEPPKKKKKAGDSSFTPRGPRRVRLMDAEQRRAALEADPYTDTVEPDRILCGLCRRWVKLRPNSTYCAAPWQSHIGRCLQKFEKDPLSNVPSEMKDPPADGEDSQSQNGVIPDQNFPAVPRGQYYRQIPEEQIEIQNNYNEPARSYYKPEKSVLEDQAILSSPDARKRRRGRPPKQAVVPQPEQPVMENVSESDKSYESEEQ